MQEVIRPPIPVTEALDLVIEQIGQGYYSSVSAAIDEILRLSETNSLTTLRRKKIVDAFEDE